jgi:hypothetical protein
VSNDLTTSENALSNSAYAGLRRVSQPALIALVLGLVALGISLWQLTDPGFLSLYNSGVYFAASFKFVQGVMPYRDFVFVQPPGLVVLLSPLALLGRALGAPHGFLAARLVTAFVGSANVSMIALLVRHRGRIAMIIAGGGLAFLPVNFFDASSVMLEPYCLFFLLAGALVVFNEKIESDLSYRTLTVAGILVGVAASIKLWALLVLLALVLSLLRSGRQRLTVLIGSAAAAFALISLPFFIAAPRQFISQVVGAQLFRSSNHSNNVSILRRMINLTGFAPTHVVTVGAQALTIFAIFAVLVVIAFSYRPRHSSVDNFLLLASLTSAGALLLAREFYSYYANFTAPFLVGLLAVTLARLGSVSRGSLKPVAIRRSVRQLVRVTAGVATVVLLYGVALWYVTQYSHFDWAYGSYGPWESAEARYVPSGACVLYSDISYGILSNRLTSTDPTCPNVVDPDGLWLASRSQWNQPTAAFVSQWRGYFERAQYVVLLYPKVSRIPWNASLTSWFDSHYHRIHGGRLLYIYENDAVRS